MFWHRQETRSLRAWTRQWLRPSIHPLTWCMRVPGRSARNPDVASAGQLESAIDVTDDAGFTVHLAKPAQRVISLIPSAMETLIAIGATNQIVGRTRYDVAPEVAALPRWAAASIRAWKRWSISIRISSSRGRATNARWCARNSSPLGIPVFILRTQDTTDIFHGIASIGRLTGHDSAATAVATPCARRSTACVDRSRHPCAELYVRRIHRPADDRRAADVHRPTDLARRRAIDFCRRAQNWPNVAMEEIVRRDPDMLVVPVGEFKTNSLERFRAMAGWRDLRAVRTGRVVSVPADLMSRPSPSIAAARGCCDTRCILRSRAPSTLFRRRRSQR